MENNILNFSDYLIQNEATKPLMEIISNVMDMPDDIPDDAVDAMIGMFRGSLTDKIRDNAVNDILQSFHNEGYSSTAATQLIANLKRETATLIDSLNPSPAKRKVLSEFFSMFNSLFDEAAQRFHLYDIELPIKLEEGAQMPTYAHDGDACADLYALEDTNLNSHTYGNKIRTGVSIQLPENWIALIFPRSSIGAKTPFRLSNSVGVIDSGYRGEIGVLYDNTNDSDSFIRKGDRIAQMMIMPRYRFKGKVVDSLDDTDRGDGGFGSTGK